METNSAYYDLDYKLQKIFEAIVECGGLSAAQHELGMSLPSISKAVSQLESRLGCKLCERGRSGYRLLEAGKEFYDSLQELNKAIHRHQIHCDAIKRQKQPLKIGLIDNTLQDVNNPLPKLLRSLTDVETEMSLSFQVQSAESIVRQLLLGELELGVSYLKNQEISGIEKVKLYQETVSAYVAESHPLLLKTETKKWFEYPKAGFTNNLSIYHQVINIEDNLEVLVMKALVCNHIVFLPRAYATIWTERGQLVPLAEELISSQVSTVFLLAKTTSKTKPVIAELFKQVQQA